MARRYTRNYPTQRKHRIDYSPLFTEDEKAVLRYNKDTAFRRFVKEWQPDAPELMGWTLADFLRAYLSGGVQLVLNL